MLLWPPRRGAGFEEHDIVARSKKVCAGQPSDTRPDDGNSFLLPHVWPDSIGRHRCRAPSGAAGPSLERWHFHRLLPSGPDLRPIWPEWPLATRLVSINGEQPRDVIQYQLLVDEPEVALEIDRGGLSRSIEVAKPDGAPLGLEVQAALFDQVRTCDNHCSFCFIYQLPPGMRKSLYLKDDDYRLSFLYGNFTTLTRFTEIDLERVVTEGLSPLYVSIHATDPEVRSELLSNRRGRRAFVGCVLCSIMG